jgi:hypothetical protein
VNEAQFGIAHLYRPDLLALTHRYQGISAKVPIAVPGTLAKDAGDSGNASDLMAGIPVSLGSRVIVWLPSITQMVGSSAGIRVAPYNYRFLWRLCDANRGGSFHLAGKTGGNRTLPAAIDTLKVTGNPVAGTWGTPVVLGDQKNQVLLTENVINPAATIPLGLATLGGLDTAPLSVNGVLMHFEEGIHNTIPGLGEFYLSYNAVQLDAMGDELGIFINPVDMSGNWDFTDPTKDQSFYEMLNTYPDFGIYVLCGTGEAGQPTVKAP